MNRQEVCDKVALHLLTQNAQALDSAGICKYRGPGRTSCAVGCLIPDEAYAPDFEGNRVFDSRVRGGLEKVLGKLTQEDLSFLVDLQDVHDSYKVESWPERLEDLARRFGLTTEVLDGQA